MKHLLLSLGLIAVPVAAAPPRPILSCPMADGTRAILLAQSHGLDGKSLFLQIDGKTAPAFQDMPDTEFVGDVVLAKCADKTIVFALNYGPPYQKGIALRKNPVSHAEERLYFAEKALPRWLYTSDRDMLVVIPNEGFETDQKYLVYRFNAGQGQPEESMPTGVLPPAEGHRVSTLR
ncbi:hypothetical protein [Niveibacterium sp.]|uniref:hypothetical protein n=1 Tax=Niveibacterium sp. TaxID=2017444 RepID=UPI0035B04A10